MKATNRITIMKPGTHANNWGDVLNSNLEILQAQISQVQADRTADAKSDHPPSLPLAVVAGACAVVGSQSPVSRKALFGWLRRGR